MCMVRMRFGALLPPKPPVHVHQSERTRSAVVIVVSIAAGDAKAPGVVHPPYSLIVTPKFPITGKLTARAEETSSTPSHSSRYDEDFVDDWAPTDQETTPKALSSPIPSSALQSTRLFIRSPAARRVGG
ncbi:hypothetical protein C8Q70DRAFT_935494 [Cubamyces menziesii]|nr:hypothetical protein C8Q70DRAFT_935494 [Cubamyces menziesii]